MSPSGIAESLILAEEFLAGSKSALVLGDNLFHGSGLGRRLEAFNNLDGAQIFGYHVQDPSPYGVATINEIGRVIALNEKPKNSESRIAIPGLYFFDESASGRARKLKPSARGELEILDLLKSYLTDMALNLEMLPRGTAWFDSGTFDDLHEAGNYVKLMQERTGERVGDPFEIARIRRWLD
jgi:glucose-1-phosphate thymidylyltransferase